MDISETRAHDAGMLPYTSFGDLDAIHAALLTDVSLWLAGDARWPIARAELASIKARIAERAEYEQRRIGRTPFQ